MSYRDFPPSLNVRTPADLAGHILGVCHTLAEDHDRRQMARLCANAGNLLKHLVADAYVLCTQYRAL